MRKIGFFDPRALVCDFHPNETIPPGAFAANMKIGFEARRER